MKNQKILIPFYLSAFIIVLMLSGCREPEDMQSINQDVVSITYFTENYPPFNYEQDGLLYGVSVDILEALFVKMGIDPGIIDAEIGEWPVVYQETLECEQTMLFSTVRMPERENLFKWVGPIAPQKQVLVAKTNGGVVIENDADMAQYTIGVIEGYSDRQVLLEAGVPVSKLVDFEDVFSMYQNLAAGTVQCIAYTEISNILILESLGFTVDDYEVAYTFNVMQLYYAFHVNTSNHLIDYFQSKLDALKMDKTLDGSSVYEKILHKYHVIQHVEDNITEAMVIDLVNLTSSNLHTDTETTINQINAGLAPYKDPANPALYAFVYDTAVTIVAHASNPLIVGVNFKGKTDAAGKPFRDEIVRGALDQGTGWVDYIYTKPDESGLYFKTSYYKLTSGSDGKLYIVCAGRYK